MPVCPYKKCGRVLRNESGYTQHIRSAHQGIIRQRRHHQPAPYSIQPLPPSPPLPSPHSFSPPPPPSSPSRRSSQASPQPSPPQSPQGPSIFLTSPTARKCSPNAEFLPSDAPPSPPSQRPPTDYFPFDNQLQFETADLLYRESQMSAGHIDMLCKIWRASMPPGFNAPFLDHAKMYSAIDAIEDGHIPWQSFNITYQGPRPAGYVPPWMKAKYDVWFRDPREVLKNMIARPDLQEHIDLTPFRDYDESGTRHYENLFSGDWAWDQADQIAQDPDTHGATFVPFVLGSDKTTVSVATGHTEYYPLYISLGNVHNNTRRAHQDAVALVGFLSVPKTNKSYNADPHFRHFCRQLYHCSLATIFDVFKSGMTRYEVVQFGDGYHRWVIWGIGPYIADYPEQVLLAGVVQGWCPRCLAFPEDLDDADALLRCEEHDDALVEDFHPALLWDSYGVIANVVPFTSDFPRADIHELLAPDILHQLIKGTFKDHLVEWVGKYLIQVHGKTEAKKIMDDIDRRISVAAPFAGLRRFPEGHDFKQWTGDDSKALMKVYLPALEGHLPDDIIRTFRAFLEFCYLVRRNALTDKDLVDIQGALDRFHHYRSFFTDYGVAATVSLPRQHSMQHYLYLVRQFGAPNGLCSSITESKHIQAVKEPWRWSSRFNALGQMLVTNQRLDKLKACRRSFAERGMILPLTDEEPRSRSIDENPEDSEAVDGADLSAEVTLPTRPSPERPKNVGDLADELRIPNLERLAHRFLFGQLHPRDPRVLLRSVPIRDCPTFPDRIKVFNSARAVFKAPSDIFGLSGMRSERIRSCPLWRGEAPRYDCAFLMTNSGIKGTLAMDIARVLAFFSFRYRGTVYPCAIVHWFEYSEEERDENTGMYVVKPMSNRDGSPRVDIVHIDSFVRAAHLLPQFGTTEVSEDLKCFHSYDHFKSFYLNKFVDHHAFEIA
ncbi:hypothetical protein CONPUDRAFT_51589 [Coniophora puteana RWD-64-598 SS2]|uniref:C2H2-type domain-containing protein n=1 Tax=Coniophora puteana (strain RWD-64-598) TaxID=741705 RepID=A0A5M3MZY3_CONPW|nr:uncharacterized protein CONPUDRAFT_51589 [Coniophora puteana RWD-64-598 SS2]EIW84557.1 hypothetical protein CONPUDRAFT_51589 [Coniophora puteana RWD-64-598 SS2]